MKKIILNLEEISAEIWKDVLHFSGYKVSNMGRLKNLKGKLKARIPNVRTKYLQTILRKDGKSYCCYVHRLVAKAFIEDSNLDVNHKDGNIWNNRLTNLEYATRKENLQHAVDTGLRLSQKGIGNNNCKYSDEFINSIRKLKGTVSQREIANKFNLTDSYVSNLFNNKQRKIV